MEAVMVAAGTEPDDVAVGAVDASAPAPVVDNPFAADVVEEELDEDVFPFKSEK